MLSSGVQRSSVSFRPTRSKGQCFLTDFRVIERIVDTLDPSPHEQLLEIGAGEGQLTLPMLERGARVLAIEADQRLATKLEKRAGDEPDLELVRADALKLNFREVLEERNLEDIRAYGNLPYSVAAPILLRLLSAGAYFRTLTLMFQKEVAGRLVARPGTKEYSFLSVVAQQAAHVEVLFRIPPDAFRPRPRVVSALVLFRLRHDAAPDFGNEKTFRALVKGLLAHRRKTITNNIKHLDAFPAERLHAALSTLDIDPTRRAETLSVEEFAELSRICTLGD